MSKVCGGCFIISFSFAHPKGKKVQRVQMKLWKIGHSKIYGFERVQNWNELRKRVTEYNCHSKSSKTCTKDFLFYFFPGKKIPH